MRDQAIPRGFTLIEMLVVIVIIGVLTTTVALTLSNDPQRAAANDAARLAALLETAAAEAQAGQRQIAWSAHEGGYDFLAAEYAPDQISRWMLLTDDDTFHARQFDGPIEISRIEIDGQPLPPGELLIFRRGDPPLFRITLHARQGDTLQPIEVHSLPTGRVLVGREE